jgi:hypothetical protein
LFRGAGAEDHCTVDSLNQTSFHECPDSNVTEESDRQSEKHLSPKTSTDEGITISTKPVSWNASFSIRDNLDPDSNATEESDLQKAKHLSPKMSTDEGRMISTKPLSRNASSSIRDNIDPDSNITDESDRQ